MTIKEAYCSFEVSKLLKEKGFNEPCRDFYRKENEEWLHRNTYEYNYFNLQVPRWEDCYSCPTHQMAMAWLRKTKRIFIRIIEDGTGEVFRYEIYNHTSDNNGKYYISNTYSDFYEEAADEALKYVLENLI